MFLDAPREAFPFVFPSTSRVTLHFQSDYNSIETAGGTPRLKTVLGTVPMNDAISILFHYYKNDLPRAFLVLFQIILEAVKFKFIETKVFMSIRNGETLEPSLAMISLQDNWAKLSSQIQQSPSLQGLFGEVVQIYDSNGRIMKLDSIYYPVIKANIAVQLYHNNNASRNTVEARSSRISGRDGYCVDESRIVGDDRSLILLKPCENKANQKFTFQRDGRIQYLGKCFTYYHKGNVEVYNCSKVEDAIRIIWKVSMDGTIRNPKSGLVLTANSAVQEKRMTNLIMEAANTHNISQCWRVGSYLNPILVSIIRIDGICLEAYHKYKGNGRLSLNNCLKVLKNFQIWALYGDGTIRLNSNRNMCLSSSLDCIPNQPVNVSVCNPSFNIRWEFLTDGTIFNPKCGMKMDVLNNVFLSSKIDQPTREWALSY